MKQWLKTHKSIITYSLIAVVLLVAIVGISIVGVNAQKKHGTPYIPEHEYAMVELGSKDCDQCQLFNKDVFGAVSEAYGDIIDIKFFDVGNTKEGAAYANKYGISGKPTIIFVDKTGKELKRLNGYQTKTQIVKIFQELGWIE